MGKEVRKAIREDRRKGKKTRRKASVVVTRPFECLMTLIVPNVDLELLLTARAR